MLVLTRIHLPLDSVLGVCSLRVHHALRNLYADMGILNSIYSVWVTSCIGNSYGWCAFLAWLDPGRLCVDSELSLLGSSLLDGGCLPLMGLASIQNWRGFFWIVFAAWGRVG